MRIATIGELDWSRHYALPGGSNTICVFELKLDNSYHPRVSSRMRVHLATLLDGLEASPDLDSLLSDGSWEIDFSNIGSHGFKLHSGGIEFTCLDGVRAGEITELCKIGSLMPFHKSVSEVDLLVREWEGLGSGEPVRDPDVSLSYFAYEYLDKHGLYTSLYRLPISVIQLLECIHRPLWASVPYLADNSPYTRAEHWDTVMLYFDAGSYVENLDKLLTAVGNDLNWAAGKTPPATSFSSQLLTDPVA